MILSGQLCVYRAAPPQEVYLLHLGGVPYKFGGGIVCRARHSRRLEPARHK